MRSGVSGRSLIQTPVASATAAARAAGVGTIGGSPMPLTPKGPFSLGDLDVAARDQRRVHRRSGGGSRRGGCSGSARSGSASPPSSPRRGPGPRRLPSGPPPRSGLTARPTSRLTGQLQHLHARRCPDRPPPSRSAPQMTGWLGSLAKVPVPTSGPPRGAQAIWASSVRVTLLSGSPRDLDRAASSRPWSLGSRRLQAARSASRCRGREVSIFSRSSSAARFTALPMREQDDEPPRAGGVRGGVRVAADDADVLARDADHLGGDLRHAGVGAGDVHRAGEDLQRAVLLERDDGAARAGAVRPLADRDAPALGSAPSSRFHQSAGSATACSVSLNATRSSGWRSFTRWSPSSAMFFRRNSTGSMPSSAAQRLRLRLGGVAALRAPRARGRRRCPACWCRRRRRRTLMFWNL